MTHIEEVKIFEAIKESIEAAVTQFGIEGVRSLSMFPSAQALNADEKLAA
jgi:hypothetical protein